MLPDAYAYNKHKALVQKYCDPAQYNFLHLNDYEITEIISESTLQDTYGIDSLKTPDLMVHDVFNYDYVGEIKGRNTKDNRKKARRQVLNYSDIMTDNHIENTPFMILDDFIKVF